MQGDVAYCVRRLSDDSQASKWFAWRWQAEEELDRIVSEGKDAADYEVGWHRSQY